MGREVMNSSGEQMTRVDKLSRMLAEHFEPIKVCGRPHMFAKAEWWRADNAGPWDSGSTTVPWYWEPKTVTEPEVFVRVLKALIQSTPVTLETSRYGDDKVAILGPGRLLLSALWGGYDGPLELAAAEALVRVLGLEK